MEYITAIIAVLSALAGLGVGHWFQSKRDDKQREWQLDDQKRTWEREKLIQTKTELREVIRLFTQIIFHDLEEIDFKSSITKMGENLTQIPPLGDDEFKRKWEDLLDAIGTLEKQYEEGNKDEMYAAKLRMAEICYSLQAHLDELMRNTFRPNLSHG